MIPELTPEEYFNENYSGTEMSEFLKPFIENAYRHGKESSQSKVDILTKALQEITFKDEKGVIRIRLYGFAEVPKIVYEAQQSK
jgi:hypothetical protein